MLFQPSGEPPEEGAAAFSTCLWGWVGAMLCLQHCWGNNLDIPFQQASSSRKVPLLVLVLVLELVPAHSAFSAGVVPNPAMATFRWGQ